MSARISRFGAGIALSLAWLSASAGGCGSNEQSSDPAGGAAGQSGAGAGGQAVGGVGGQTTGGVDGGLGGEDGGSGAPTYEPGFHQAALTCSDGIKNGLEEGTDCGGPCAACAPPAAAHVLYISESVGNDGWSGTLPEPNAGSTDGPWRTLERLHGAWSDVQPGYFILLRRGDRWAPASSPGAGLIAPPQDKAGEQGAPITIGAYGNGALPIVSVANQKNKSAFDSGGLSYFDIEDLELRGTVSMNASTPSGIHHVRFRRIVWDGAAPGDETGGSIFFFTPPFVETAPETWDKNPIHDLEFGFCRLQNNSQNDILNFNTPEGNIWIHHNEFYNSLREALDFGGGDNLVVEYNLISGGKEANAVKVQPQLHTIDNLILRGNLVVHPNTEANWYALVVMNARHAQIYNNTLIGNNVSQIGSGAAYLGWMVSAPPYLSGLGAWGFDDNVIHDNIFVGFVTIGTAEGVEITFADATSYAYQQDEIWADNTFANNILHNPKSSDYLLRLFHFNALSQIWYDENTPGFYANNEQWGVTLTEELISSSTFASTWLSHPTVSGDVNADPMFVAPVWTSPFDFGDYHLQAGSPASGRGCYP